MRCSLNLHLRSAHEKPQQPDQFDSPTDPAQYWRQKWPIKVQGRELGVLGVL